MSDDLTPFDKSGSAFDPIPARAGIGLKARHYDEILQRRPDVGWFEIHPENFMTDGGAPLHAIAAIREFYPFSLHGVGLSLGSPELSDDHLKKLKILVDVLKPGLVSEHLSWSEHGGQFFNDLLPLPLTREALDRVANNVDRLQNTLKRRILVENPSTYLTPRHQDMQETDFLADLARRTGCGLLLDVNNVFVCASNHGFDPGDYLDAIPWDLISEIHLAGHAVETIDGADLRIDNHGSPVSQVVWDLFSRLIRRIGATPILVEWDTDVPELDVLLDQAATAEKLAEQAFGLGPVLGSRHARVA